MAASERGSARGRRWLYHRDADLGDSRPIGTWRGGRKLGWLGGWTYPFVTLALYPIGIELKPTVRAMWVVLPVWRARLEEIPTVDAVKDLSGARGVRFMTKDGSCVAFGAPGAAVAEEVMTALEGLGVAVDRTLSRLHTLGPPRL